MKIEKKDDSEKDFNDRVKKTTTKYKELAQTVDVDYTIAIVTSQNFISQFFAYITNGEHYFESKYFF